MTNLTRVKCHNHGAVIRCARGRKRVRRGTDALSLPARQAATLSHFLHQRETPSHPCGHTARGERALGKNPQDLEERREKTCRKWESVAGHGGEPAQPGRVRGKFRAPNPAASGKANGAAAVVPLNSVKRLWPRKWMILHVGRQKP